MSESLEGLRAIIDSAPEGAVSVFNGIYLDNKRNFWSDGWFGIHDYIEVKQPVRSLSDINRIIELMERVNINYEAYTRIESIKQKYNAENKQMKELLKDITENEDLDDCRFLLADKILKGE